jgi:trans-aconitate methyltransferase
VTGHLGEQYRRQYAWRSWSVVYESLGDLRGQTVLDLGCGPGDQAADLAARGATVVGIDLDETLLATARSRRIPGASFVKADITDPRTFRGRKVDGIWISFAAAYVTSIDAALALWSAALSSGGWLAITEVDDLFGHEPLNPAHRALILSYYQDALDNGRYDFCLRHRLRRQLAAASWQVTLDRDVTDAELSFDGPATHDILEAWTLRLSRMQLLASHFGPDWPDFRAEFLASLSAPQHRSLSTVWSVLARPAAA